MLPDRDPRQGPRAHRALGLLVRADRERSSRTTCSPCARTGARPSAGGSRCSRSSASSAATCRLGLEGLPRDRRGLRPPAARRARRVASGCPSRSSRRRRRPRPGHDENIDRAAAVALVGEARFDEVERIDARALPLRLRDAPLSAGSSWPTRSSSSASTRTGGSSSATRRSRPTRPASGRPTSTRPAARQPSFDKQFVRDYCETLGWDKTYPGPELPARRRRRAPARATSRRSSGSPGIDFDDYLADPSVGARDEGDGARPAEGRHPRPAGPGGREQPAPPRLRRRRGASVGRLVELELDDRTTATRRARRSSGCASSCSRTR